MWIFSLFFVPLLAVLEGVPAFGGDIDYNWELLQRSTSNYLTQLRAVKVETHSPISLLRTTKISTLINLFTRYLKLHIRVAFPSLPELNKTNTEKKPNPLNLLKFWILFALLVYTGYE